MVVMFCDNCYFWSACVSFCTVHRWVWYKSRLQCWHIQRKPA